MQIALVRCYLGASQRNRHPNPLVNLAIEDDIPFSALYPGMEFHEQQLRPAAPHGAANAKPASEPTADDRFRAKKQCFNETRDEKKEGSQFHGPLHLINGALNEKASTIHNSRPVKAARTKTSDETQAESLQFLERKAESFIFSPLYCGSEATGYCPAFEFADDIKLGTAVAVSGAAVSPNMGYHSSPAITALLTVFNVRLGAWFGNPGRETRSVANPAASAKLLISELAGMTSSDTDYVYVSDGGHFENMGVYELIRRRCRFILAIDAGADPKFHENVGRIVRQVRIDFGIWIEVDIAPASPDANGRCQSHMIVGRIRYDDVHKSPIKPTDPYQDDPTFNYEQNHGIIVWMKNSLTGDEPGDLMNYAAMNPNFPYDSTLNQFFNESQFESYRALGIHATLKSLSVAKPMIDRHATTREIFESLHDYWLKRPPNFVPSYTGQNDTYSGIQRQLREDKSLVMLAQELYGTSEECSKSRAAMADSSPDERLAERLMANEMFTALENVWLNLDLERQSKQPIYEGWMEVFGNWTSSQRLQRCWDGEGATPGISREFSPAFVRFIKSLMHSPSLTIPDISNIKEQTMSNDSYQAKLAANRKQVEEHLRVEGAQQMDALLNTFGDEPFFYLNTQRTDGKDGIRTVYSDLFAGFPDLQTTVKNWYVGEDAVVVETVLSGTHKATWNGIPATGKSVAVPMCAIFPIDSAGKLKAEIVYFDSVILLQQLGLMPAPATN